ncbi:MAG: hypothetical protein GX801_00085 [Fibrobacter sp.]|nr:hypothetical protein [Fibrobacter sp.]
MSELLCAYTKNADNWWLQPAKGTTENRLLLLQAGSAELSAYKKLGWDAKSLVLAPGLALDNDKDVIYMKDLSASWPLSDWDYHSVICNHGFSDLWERTPDFCIDCVQGLAEGGTLNVRLNNPRYFLNLILKTSREYITMPNSLTMADTTLRLKRLIQHLEFLGFDLQNKELEIDESIKNTMLKGGFQHRDLDVLFYFSNFADNLEVLYIKNYRLTFVKD